MSDEEQEMAGRRGNDFCPMHEANTSAIGKHSGQWKVLLWLLGIGIGMMTTIAGSAYYAQQESMRTIAISVHSIDKVMSNYVASHTVESEGGFRRIRLLESCDKDIKVRINNLESLCFSLAKHHKDN